MTDPRPNVDVIELTPISSERAAAVDRLAELFILRLQRCADVRIQHPLHLDAVTWARPDLTLLRPSPDFYASGHPNPPDVLLVVDIDDGTERPGPSVARYALAQVREAWTIDLAGGVVDVATDPGPAGYRQRHRARRGEVLAPAAIPDLVIAVADLLG